jgi:hypothetical protein
MKTLRRSLIVSKVEYGIATAGRCSVCPGVPLRSGGGVRGAKRGQRETGGPIRPKVCDKGFSQAAARIVREAAEK